MEPCTTDSPHARNEPRLARHLAMMTALLLSLAGPAAAASDRDDDLTPLPSDASGHTGSNAGDALLFKGSGGTAAGTVLTSWSAGSTFVYGIAFATLPQHDVWLSSPGPDWGGASWLRDFGVNGTPGPTSLPYTWSPSTGPADATFNRRTRTVWVLNVGTPNCIFELDRTTGSTMNQICPGGGTGFSRSERGLAYDPVNDQYFAGGWNTQSIHRFLPNGTITQTVNVDLSISGLAYNPATRHLFAFTRETSGDRIFVLDEANDFASLGQLSLSSSLGSHSGGGLTIDCDGDLWAVNYQSNTVFEISSGETGEGVCDLPVTLQSFAVE